jgi:hypothetical protein
MSRQTGARYIFWNTSKTHRNVKSMTRRHCGFCGSSWTEWAEEYISTHTAAVKQVAAAVVACVFEIKVSCVAMRCVVYSHHKRTAKFVQLHQQSADGLPPPHVIASTIQLLWQCCGPRLQSDRWSASHTASGMTRPSDGIIRVIQVTPTYFSPLHQWEDLTWNTRVLI